MSRGLGDVYKRQSGKVHANGKQLQEPLLKHPVQPVHPANRNAKFITIHVWLKVIKQPVTVTVHGK